MKRLYLLVLLFSVRVLHAAPSQDRQSEAREAREARAHFLKAEKLCLLATKLDECIQEYEAANAIRPNPLLMFKIANAYQQSGQSEKAIDFYDRFVNLDPDSDEGKEAKRRLEKLRTQTAETERGPARTETQPAVSKPPEPAISQGSPGSRQVEQSVSLVSSPLGPKRAPRPPVARPPVYKRWWFWTAIGVGAAAIAVPLGIVYGTQTGSDPLDGISAGNRRQVAF